MHTAYRSPAITLTSQPSPDLHADLLIIPVFTATISATKPRWTRRPVEVLRAQGGAISPASCSRHSPPRPRSPTGRRRAPCWSARGVAPTSRPIICAALRSSVALRPGSGASRVSRDPSHRRRQSRPRRRPRSSPRACAWPISTAGRIEQVRRPPGSKRRRSRVSDDGPGVRKALERGQILGDCSNQARTLANAPGNELTPRVFAERATRQRCRPGVRDPRRAAHRGPQDGHAARVARGRSRRASSS